MRSVLVLLITAILASAAAVPVAAEGESHSCAGASSSAIAQALGPVFGDAVSDFAQVQLVDNLGLANCDGSNGQNP